MKINPLTQPPARFPIFIRAKDSGELRKFSSVHELQRKVERIDIENGEYEAWDNDGRGPRIRPFLTGSPGDA